MPKFEPTTDIPSLKGKVCLVTGANSGLGEATVSALAQHEPEVLYLAARSRSKAEAALSRIRATSKAAASANIQILDLDLASLDSVRQAAVRVNNEVERLDILQLNAGIAMVPHATTKDGYEIQFGTNHVGHALLTLLLMPLLIKTAARPSADVRIISVSSVGHRSLANREGILFDKLKTDMKDRSTLELYGQAKLANVLFAFELAKRYPQITSSSLHPGTVKSSIWGGEKTVNSFLRYAIVNPLVYLTGVSNEVGAKTQLWCSFSKEVENGRYYEPVGKAGKDGPLSRSDTMAKQLWEWTEQELAAHGDPAWP
jgi:NAD(P)-dependent dehydrogenase (short-subunit alcohol dehydrogenase family)